MQAWFSGLARALDEQVAPGEVGLLLALAEDSDFVRLNRARVRQAGSVAQREIHLELVRGGRHAAARFTASGVIGEDAGRLGRRVGELRERLAHLPEDPYLLYATEVRSSERAREGTLPTAADAVLGVRDLAGDRDLVGLYAAGRLGRGFANTLGQRNWFEGQSFHLDWSLVHERDRAVKCSYAGTQWEEQALRRKMAEADRRLEALRRPARRVPPGAYRAYLAPAAVHEIMGLLGAGGFGLKAQRTKQSPLLRMWEGAERLSDRVRVEEDTAGGVGPDFQEQGFLKPGRVPLIEAGRAVGSLVSPRSAREYGVPTNGASATEAPESLAMAPGSLPEARAVERLGTGVWIGNLHYLNYSDVPACRTTGMTRFATFWVEGGEIAAPLEVMRFDETIYRTLGSRLVDLTCEREHVLDSDTYQRRSTASARVPGALVEEFTFTL